MTAAAAHTLTNNLVFFSGVWPSQFSEGARMTLILGLLADCTIDTFSPLTSILSSPAAPPCKIYSLIKSKISYCFHFGLFSILFFSTFFTYWILRCCSLSRNGDKEHVFYLLKIKGKFLKELLIWKWQKILYLPKSRVPQGYLVQESYQANV